jgi:LytS/YehU family sensor histidine kinase
LLLAAREGQDSRILIINQRMEILADERIPVEPWDWNISHWSAGSIHRLYINSGYITSGNTGVFIDMKPNKYYYLGYLTYPLIYFFFLFFIILIKRINTIQIVKKEDLRKKLITLQLQGIKAQFDPHFTFNTMNSVASLIYNNDRQTAYDYMNRFSQLLRSMLNDADKIYRKLGEEIEFVKSYLELEKLRFGDKFNYSVTTREGVSLQEEVPKLVLHTFAENAVKHGLIPCQEGGRLNIVIERKPDYLTIMVEDNGIGRANAANGNSTGKGLRLTTEFYEILNQINREPIKYDITDLFDELGNPSGTRVDIRVPLRYASSE